jgi:hypothetical protein
MVMLIPTGCVVGRQHLAAGAPVGTVGVGMAMPTYATGFSETLYVGMVMPTYTGALKPCLLAWCRRPAGYPLPTRPRRLAATFE